MQIAKCTWYVWVIRLVVQIKDASTTFRLLFYIDDLSNKIPRYLSEFQKRLITEGDDPKDDFFRVHREFLADYYRLFDPIAANCIILSSLDFMNGCVLEESPTIQDMKMTEASRSWPDFLRRKTGYAHAYAYMLFPVEANVELSTYIQVIDDMADVINLVNDVLS